MSSQDNPLVSIVTPVFNEVKYIEKCIQSVLTQSYPHIEHMIVDGGSSDGTVEILSSYKNKYPDKIRFVSEPDKGAGDAWNKGLKMTKGDIFGILGADDLYMPGVVEMVVEFFRFHPEAYFVIGDCENINEKGETLGISKVERFNFHEFVNTAKYIATTSAFYKRAVMEKIGWLDSSGDDFDVMIRIAKNFKVYRIDEVLSRLTVRPNSVFNSPSNFKALKEQRKQTFKVSRLYGGGLFSPLALRYYFITIIGWLQLSLFYPFVRSIYKKIVKPKI